MAVPSEATPLRANTKEAPPKDSESKEVINPPNQIGGLKRVGPPEGVPVYPNKTALVATAVHAPATSSPFVEAVAGEVKKAPLTCGRTCQASLAFNCLQWPMTSCYKPSGALRQYKSTLDKANWMAKVMTAQDEALAVSKNNKSPTSVWKRRIVPPFREWVLPGTHHSGSCTIPNYQPYSAMSQTQSLSLLEQLRAGARYLDVRVAPGGRGGGEGDSNVGIRVQHGCCGGSDLEPMLDQIVAFLNRHAGEFVLLEISPEFSRQSAWTTDKKKVLLALITEIFGSKILPAKDWQEDPDRTLQEIIRQGRQIAVFIHDRFWENEEETSLSAKMVIDMYGLMPSNQFLRNRWFNTRDTATLLGWNLEEISHYGNTTTRGWQWQMNQFVLTPGVGGVADVLSSLCGINPLQPLLMATDLYHEEQVAAFLRKHAKKPWNLLMLDFIELCPLVVDMAISFNARPALVVDLAIVDLPWCGLSKNVTAMAQENVLRNSVLVLTHPVQDLKLPFEVDTDNVDVEKMQSCGILTLAYRLGHQCWIQSLPLYPTKPILVSAMGANVESEAVELQPYTKGFVHQGRIYSSMQEFREAQESHGGSYFCVGWDWSASPCTFCVGDSGKDFDDEHELYLSTSRGAEGGSSCNNNIPKVIGYDYTTGHCTVQVQQVRGGGGGGKAGPSSAASVAGTHVSTSSRHVP